MTNSKTKPSLTGLTISELKKMFDNFDQPAYRAEQVYQWIHHFQVSSFEEMTNLPKLFRAALSQHFRIGSLCLNTRQVSSDGTQKYLWELDDGKLVESVFIPVVDSFGKKSRNTICISSQVGCALGCAFCATAKMGFMKNLSAGEIVEQVIRVQQDTGEKITNVVFMGMGEPFLNYHRVISASKILSDPAGLAISAQKITISTVGIVPRIIQFTDENQPFKLAISLHAPTQALRVKFMPVAEKFSLDTLMQSAQYYTQQQTRKRITFEYVLLEGVNDTPQIARKLLKLLSTLRCKLNLIPYNDTGIGFSLPDEQRIQAFVQILENAPFPVMVRKNRGNDIAAACGQLYTKAGEEQSPRFIKAESNIT